MLGLEVLTIKIGVLIIQEVLDFFHIRLLVHFFGMQLGECQPDFLGF